MFQLRVASKKRTKLRLAISGSRGGGKTLTALKVAKHLIGEPYLLDDPSKSRIGLIDSERSSAEFYADEFHFHHGNLPPELWNPVKFTEALHMAEASCDVVILDSISHEWRWCLNQVDILKPKFSGNQWSAWSAVKPPHDLFIDSLMASPAHVICTMRSKMETKMVDKKVINIGLESVQDAEIDYAFHVIVDMDSDTHSGTVRKSRIRIKGENPLDGQVFPLPGEAFTKLIVDCINTGEVVEVERPAAPDAPAEKPMAPQETAAAAAGVANAAAIAAALVDDGIRRSLAAASVKAEVDAIVARDILPLGLGKQDPRRAVLLALVKDATARVTAEGAAA